MYTMASSSCHPRAMAAPAAPHPTMNDSHGVVQKASYQPLQRLQGIPSRQPNGSPKSRLLTVDEALQYSPLSSIVPFSSSKSWCSVQSILDHAHYVNIHQTLSEHRLPIFPALSQSFQQSWMKIEPGSQWSFSTRICCEVMANSVLQIRL